ncbi:SH3 domain-containing protein [Candidatus Fermentibacteria bacterium]|nr:SH3 domain-containing protein [Candidatus Fermentibacteria bacterium]
MRRFCIVVVLLVASLMQAQESGAGKALVARRWANVRTEPSTSSAVLRRVFEGEAFDVLEMEGQWVRVRIDERTMGWIFKDLVTLEHVVPPTTGGPTEPAEPTSASRDWVYVLLVLVCGVAATAAVYWGLSRHQKLFDYAGRLDRMTSSAYIDNVSRDDVVRLTKAFGIGDRLARSVARQTYLDRYRVSSSHQKLTDREKMSFRKLQTVLALGDEDVMRIMAKVYKTKRHVDRVEA